MLLEDVDSKSNLNTDSLLQIRSIVECFDYFLKSRVEKAQKFRILNSCWFIEKICILASKIQLSNSYSFSDFLVRDEILDTDNLMLKELLLSVLCGIVCTTTNNIFVKKYEVQDIFIKNLEMRTEDMKKSQNYVVSEEDQEKWTLYQNKLQDFVNMSTLALKHL